MSGASIPRSDGMVVATMATFPARAESAALAVASLLPQVDRLYIYFNGYDTVPAFAQDDRIVSIVGGPDLSAIGKTVAFDYISNSIVLTVDDDFVYPADYVSRLLSILQRHQGRALVCVHGSIFAPGAQWYYERSTVYTSRKSLGACSFAMLAGSGTAAFDQSALNARYEQFAGQVAVDLKLSLLARNHGIPIICIDREAEWLKPLRPDGGLWKQFTSRITHHTEIMHQNGPWTFDRYGRIIRDWFVKTHGSLDRERWVSLGLDERFLDAITRGQAHPDWCVTANALKRKREYRALLAKERKSSPLWNVLNHSLIRNPFGRHPLIRHPRKVLKNILSLYLPTMGRGG